MKKQLPFTGISLTTRTACTSCEAMQDQRIHSHCMDHEIQYHMALDDTWEELDSYFAHNWGDMI